VLIKNPGQNLPDWFRGYLVERLQGRAPTKRGPAAHIQDEVYRAKLLLARLTYAKAHRIARFLAANRRRIAARRGETLPRATTAAHQLALLFVINRAGLFSEHSPESLLNLLKPTTKRAARSSGSLR
jgi:hypothetical protein